MEQRQEAEEAPKSVEERFKEVVEFLAGDSGIRSYSVTERDSMFPISKIEAAIHAGQPQLGLFLGDSMVGLVSLDGDPDVNHLSCIIELGGAYQVETLLGDAYLETLQKYIDRGVLKLISGTEESSDGE